MQPSQDANDNLGLRVRASVEHITLLCGSDVFEHENPAFCPGVAHAAEKIGDASAYELSAVAAKEQLALDPGLLRVRTDAWKAASLSQRWSGGNRTAQDSNGLS